METKSDTQFGWTTSITTRTPRTSWRPKTIATITVRFVENIPLVWKGPWSRPAATEVPIDHRADHHRRTPGQKADAHRIRWVSPTMTTDRGDAPTAADPIGASPECGDHRSQHSSQTALLADHTGIVPFWHTTGQSGVILTTPGSRCDDCSPTKPLLAKQMAWPQRKKQRYQNENGPTPNPTDTTQERTDQPIHQNQAAAWHFGVTQGDSVRVSNGMVPTQSTNNQRSGHSDTAVRYVVLFPPSTCSPRPMVIIVPSRMETMHQHTLPLCCLPDPTLVLSVIDFPYDSKMVYNMIVTSVNYIEMMRKKKRFDMIDYASIPPTKTGPRSACAFNRTPSVVASQHHATGTRNSGCCPWVAGRCLRVPILRQ